MTLKHCMGDFNKAGTKLHLFASTGYLPNQKFHEIDIHNNGKIEYHENGHLVENSIACDQLMEMFLAGKLKIIA